MKENTRVQDKTQWLCQL